MVASVSEPQDTVPAVWDYLERLPCKGKAKQGLSGVKWEREVLFSEYAGLAWVIHLSVTE